MKKNICENCKCEFERQYVRRFCGLKCWHSFNAKTIASYNDRRFKWEAASEDEKRERIKIRFESNVVRSEGCWDWEGYFDKDGYPLLSSGVKGKGFHERRGHRISWWLYKGDIPSNKLICHKCDNPRCTNPDHLFIGTDKENHDDMKKKKRGNLGSKHGNSKLNESQVLEIRNKFKDGVMIKRVMSDYNISRQTAHDIKYGNSWKHVF